MINFKVGEDKIINFYLFNESIGLHHFSYVNDQFKLELIDGLKLHLDRNDVDITVKNVRRKIEKIFNMVEIKKVNTSTSTSTSIRISTSTSIRTSTSTVLFN